MTWTSTVEIDEWKEKSDRTHLEIWLDFRLKLETVRTSHTTERERERDEKNRKAPWASTWEKQSKRNHSTSFNIGDTADGQSFVEVRKWYYKYTADRHSSSSEQDLRAMVNVLGRKTSIHFESSDWHVLLSTQRRKRIIERPRVSWVTYLARIGTFPSSRMVVKAYHRLAIVSIHC